MKALEGEGEGLVACAEEQSQGRGCRGRSWIAPPHKALLFSILLRSSLDRPPLSSAWITFLTGLAIRKAILAQTGLPIVLKWPNDLVFPGTGAPPWKKAGGILAEGRLSASRAAPDDFLVLGIGLNVNQTQRDLPPLPQGQATSLFLEWGRMAGRLELLAMILEGIEKELDLARDAGERARQKDELEKVMKIFFKDRLWLVKRRAPAALLKGVFAGLDPSGALILKKEDGSKESILDAELLGNA
jgi:BirA family biotin operon repressor/biotin-[acetyl-CoA-carboxylase] ligase